jgi:hypothetical protein
MPFLIIISLAIISALLTRLLMQKRKSAFEQRKKRQEALRRARTGHAYTPSGKRIVLIGERDDMQRIIQS